MEAYLHIPPLGIGTTVVREWLDGIRLNNSRVHSQSEHLGLVPRTEWRRIPWREKRVGLLEIGAAVVRGWLGGT